MNGQGCVARLNLFQLPPLQRLVKSDNRFISHSLALIRWRSGIVPAGIIGFLIALSHGVAIAFVYDANSYWTGVSNFLTSHKDFQSPGLLSIRGVFTVLAYSPAALFSKYAGASASGIAVLVQNAALIAFVGAVLLPALASKIIHIRPVHVLVSVILTSSLTAGFAPYPLMDIPAVALVLTGILLLASNGRRGLLWAGICLGVGINLRPFYLAPVLLLSIIWLVSRWRRAAWPIAGAFAAVLPQLFYERVVNGVWRPWPIQTFALSDIQSKYASFIVRYDTIAFDGSRNPQQFFCSPMSADLFPGSAPSSTTGLIVATIQHLPSSVIFLFEKLSATFFWSTKTPYEASPPVSIGLLTLAVTAISAAGIVLLVRVAFRSRLIDAPRNFTLVLLALVAGSSATIAFSTPEPRFALPILLVGIIGCLVGLDGFRAIPRRGGQRVGIAVTASVIVLVLISGSFGLAYPAPPGDATLVACRTQ